MGEELEDDLIEKEDQEGDEKSTEEEELFDDLEEIPSEAEKQTLDEETIAMVRGWKPKSKWKGDTRGWTDAKTFNADWSANNPKLRAQVGVLERQVKMQGKAAKLLIDTIKKTHEQEIERINEDMRSAVENADVEAFDKAKDAAAFLGNSPEFPETEDDQQAYDPDKDINFWNWVEQNEWYARDEDTGLPNDIEKADYADKVGARLAQQGINPEKDGAEFYKKVGAAVNRKFKTQNERTPLRMETGRASAHAKSNGKGWNDIPIEDRREIKRIWGGTDGVIDSQEGRAAFAKTFFEDDGA